MKILILLVSLLTLGASAQTVTPNENSIVLQAPKKIGMNLNAPTYYQGGEIYKNLLWRNPGFEPDLYRDKFVAYKAGTTTTFPSPNPYDPVIRNFWAGATFRLYRGAAPAAICSGTIAGNSVTANGQGPVYTFSAPCATAVQTGDVIILRQSIRCTDEAVWEGQGAGWWGSVTNGGRLVSECAAPYDGTQSLRLDASVAASNAKVTGYLDTNPTDVGILLNGQFAITGHYRTIGSPTLTVDGRRLVASATGNPFTCSGQTFAPSATWTTFTVTCPASETRQVGFGPVAITLAAQGGVVIVDDVSFQKSAGTDPANTTVFRDELLTTLKAHCAGASLSAVPCELRDWAFQNADEIANTIKPIFERQPTIAGTTYDYPPNGAVASMSVGLEEFLNLCRAIDAEPYYTLPETTAPEEAAAWIEYLNGSSATPYGAMRAAHGQAASWLDVFPTIHLPMGNENWNEGITGQGLGFRGDAPDYYYDYSLDAARVWSRMRAGGSWPAGGSGIDLVLGFQNGAVNYGVTEAMARANPNSAELAPYTQAYVGDVSSLPSLWNPLLYEVVANTTNPATVFYQQGNAIKAHGKLNVYEFDNGTSQGSAGLTQGVLDQFTDAAGYGTATALQALQHLSFGIVDQNFFSLDQFAFSIPGIGWIHNWGAVVDMGGATDAVRPQELGMRMANAAIIGPMYACPVANPTTYDLRANHNGPDSNGTVPADKIAQEYAFCFESGMSRSMIVINTDVSSAHAIDFAGAQAPQGAVVVTRYAPASISDTNESTGNDSTQFAPQKVAIDAAFTATNLGRDTLPPYSITRYDWTSAGGSSLTPTATQLAASVTDLVLGAPLTLQASVSPSTASGTVLFQEGNAVLGTATVRDGSAYITLPTVGAGGHTYSASYSGSRSFAGSSSSTTAVTARAATSILLAASSLAPAGGSAVTLIASLNAQVSGTVKFLDGTVVVGAVNLSSGRAALPIASIAAGAHVYTATYAGGDQWASSTSNAVAVTATLTPVRIVLTASNTRPSEGSTVTLMASTSNSSAAGSVTFLDGAVPLQVSPLSGGGAVYTVPAIEAGLHRYTAVYRGDSGTPGSNSTSTAAVTVQTVTPRAYLQTSFTSIPPGASVNQTRPELDPVSSAWSDPNGDWSYQVGGGLVSSTADLTYPLLIDARHSDFTAVYNLTEVGARLLLRYVDSNNMLLLQNFGSEVDLYATVKGSTTKLTTLYLTEPSRSVAVTLKGTYAGVRWGNQAVSATVPSGLLSGTKLGFISPARGFVVESFSVSQ